MTRPSVASARHHSIVPHILAGGLALLYAWIISQTRYFTTSVQFVSPLAVILIVHLAWFGLTNRLTPGYARSAIGRTAGSAIGIMLCTLLAAAFAPMPAEAAGEWYTPILGPLACLAVLALVVAVVGGGALVIIYVFTWLKKLILQWLGRRPGGGTHLHDAGAVALALIAIGAASLEGLSPALSFAVADGASRTFTVAAPPARVWQEVAKATSPAFPLPLMLKSIPQPVAVLVDTGADLGSRRVVRFKGREGEGDLVLEVVRRTPEEAVFEARSDTSPIAQWIRQRALTFRVEPADTGSRLTVSSTYDRLLSPAWFFRPYVRLAAFLAVDVLARDTKARAEARSH